VALGEVDSGDAGHLGEDGENDEVLRIEVSTMGVVAASVSRGSAMARLEGGGVCGDASEILVAWGHRISFMRGRGERGGRGLFIVGLGLQEGLGFSGGEGIERLEGIGSEPDSGSRWKTHLIGGPHLSTFARDGDVPLWARAAC
jgi:hypothetical protein